jgi:hypothetical protein
MRITPFFLDEKNIQGNLPNNEGSSALLNMAIKDF